MITLFFGSILFLLLPSRMLLITPGILGRKLFFFSSFVFAAVNAKEMLVRTCSQNFSAVFFFRTEKLIKTYFLKVCTTKKNCQMKDFVTNPFDDSKKKIRCLRASERDDETKKKSVLS